MPDITITPANVQPGAKALTNKGISGEAILAGDVVARDNTTGLIKKADANDPTVGGTISTPIGIATCSTPGINQTVLYVSSDTHFVLGGTTVPGIPYFLSSNAGRICVSADLVSGMKTSLVGFGATTAALPANFIVNIVPSGQAI